MPYVGFSPVNDPGLRKALKGHKRTRKRVSEVIPAGSMRWRLEHPCAEELTTGRRLVPDKPPEDWHPPLRVVAYGVTTRLPLMVYYLCPWPDGPQPWPDLSPTPRENP